MAINLLGYVYDSVGVAKSATVEAWIAGGGAASFTTPTDAFGMWNHAALDVTKDWRIKVIDGTKVQWIDGRSKVQLAELDLTGFVNVNTISEHTAAAGVTIDSLLVKDGTLTVADNLLLKLGTDADGVLLNRSTSLLANTALAGVLIGTPVTQAIAANSLMIANVTANGDIGIYVNRDGNSQMVFWADDDTNSTAVMAAGGGSVDVYIAGVKVLDYATGAFTFQQSVTISSTGTLTIGAATLGGAVAGGGQIVSNLGGITVASAGYLNALNNADGDYFTIGARDSDTDAIVEVARVFGAADPYFAFGGTQQNKFYNSGIVTIGGAATFSAAINANLGIVMGSAEVISCAGTGANGWIIRDPANLAPTALSGAQMDIRISIGGVSYYFTVYPTKAP